jgi:hypothetical protein
MSLIICYITKFLYHAHNNTEVTYICTLLIIRMVLTGKIFVDLIHIIVWMIRLSVILLALST